MWETKLNASKALQPSDSSTNGNGSVGASGNSRNTAREKSSSANHHHNHHPEIKGEYDPTRSALQALPHSMYPERVKKMGASAPQVDGGVDGSSSDEDDDDDEIGELEPGVDEDEEDKTNNEEHSEYEGKEDPDPLNSDDDLTDQSEPDNESDLFDTEHVIVCQYDKVNLIVYL